MSTGLRYHHKEGWCTFCDEVHDKQTSNFRRIISYSEIPNVRLMDTEHFFVVPGLGPMDQCYILILPKESYVSMASLPAAWDTELRNLKAHLRKILSQFYAGPLMFEHGPAVDGSLMAGCCVEHAHIHVFAVKADLLSDLQSDFANKIFGAQGDFEPRKISSFNDLKSWVEQGISYLWYETNEEEQWGFPLIANIQSQYMRRLLSQRLGLSDPQWDWTLYPGKEKIIDTWKILSNHLTTGL